MRRPTIRLQSLAIAVGLVAALAAASCSASATTVQPGDLVEAQADTTSCRYFPQDALPDLEREITSLLGGAELDAAEPDPCTKRFVAGAEWIELRFTEPDQDVLMFDAGLVMTNGVDRTRTKTSDGVPVDVVASTSSPRSISTWDASLLGASLIAGS